MSLLSTKVEDPSNSFMDITYLFYLGFLKLSSHHYFTCKVATFVWYKIFNWLDWCVVLPTIFCFSFRCFIRLVEFLELQEYVLWYAMIWLIWKSLHNIVFLDKSVIVNDVEHEHPRDLEIASCLIMVTLVLFWLAFRTIFSTWVDAWVSLSFRWSTRYH